MKTKSLLAMGLCAAIGIFGTQSKLAAQESKDHQEHKEGESKIQIPDTRDGILKEIAKHHQGLADTVKAKKLSEVHEHAFAIRDLAKALPGKVNSDHKKWRRAPSSASRNSPRIWTNLETPVIKRRPKRTSRRWTPSSKLSRNTQACNDACAATWLTDSASFP